MPLVDVALKQIYKTELDLAFGAPVLPTDIAEQDKLTTALAKAFITIATTNLTGTLPANGVDTGGDTLVTPTVVFT